MKASLGVAMQGTGLLMVMSGLVLMLLALPFLVTENRDPLYPWPGNVCFVPVNLVPEDWEASRRAVDRLVDGVSDVMREGQSSALAMSPFGSGFLFHMAVPCDDARVEVRLLVEDIRAQMSPLEQEVLPAFEISREQATKYELACGKGVDETSCPDATRRTRAWVRRLMEHQRGGS